MTIKNVIGFSLIIAVIVITSLMTGLKLVGLLNIPAGVGVLLGMLGAVLAADKGLKPRGDTLRVAGKSAWIMGIITSVIGIISVLTHLDDPKLVGPNLAVALLALLYGAILCLFCELLRQRIIVTDMRKDVETE